MKLTTYNIFGMVGGFQPSVQDRSRNSVRRSWKTRLLLTIFLGVSVVLVLLANLETDYHISPPYTVQIADDAMAPVAGVRVEHPWASGALCERGTQKDY